MMSTTTVETPEEEELFNNETLTEVDDDDDEPPTPKLKERPLYFWLSSFAGREIEEDAGLSTFISSNALNYALEYIGITPEAEQSSLHLSAIFDEEPCSSKERSRSLSYPTHYESETKTRIQTLNRTFLELKSFFEDRFSQLVALRPPNSVHITSSCPSCSVGEFEKVVSLLLGAAIQGSQKQETIRTIKRFPSQIQEALISRVKVLADSPELLTVKSWGEFQTLDLESQRKIYEALLSLLRKIILERNDLAQAQLISDYFAGYTNCDQRRGHDSLRGCYAGEDTRLSTAMRGLKEQLVEKSELLQECKEELEKARNRILELEIEVNEMKQKHRAMKKARDELDALRESQDKAVRLEAELGRLRGKLEESEMVYERVESLEIENRSWQVKHDMLLDQISFLSFEKSSRDNSFDQMNTYTGILDELTENLKSFNDEDEDDDDRAFFDSESNSKDTSGMSMSLENNEEVIVPDTSNVMNTSSSTIQPDSSPEKEDVQFFRPTSLDISQSDNVVTSTPKQEQAPFRVEFKSQEVQTPTQSLRVKRRRRPSLLNLKRTRKAIIIPVPQGQKLPSVPDIDKVGGDSAAANLLNNSSPTIQFYKVYSVDRKRGTGKPKKFTKSPTKKASSANEKQVVPNGDEEEEDRNGGNDADEELSISPTGNPNLSDLDSNTQKGEGGSDDNDSDIYFVCSPANSNGTNTPKRTFGTTTAFPISPITNTTNVRVPGLRRTEFAFNPHNLSDLQVQIDGDDRHSNHLTIYSRDVKNNEGLPNNNNNRHVTTRGLTHAHIPPYSRHSHNGQGSNSQSNSNSNSEDHYEDEEEEDASNLFTFGDYNIQLNLRNSIKPSTALINKITTLAGSPQRPPPPEHNGGLNGDVDPYHIETSSEDDGSIWYEYGCV